MSEYEYDDGGGAVLAEFLDDPKAAPFPERWEVGMRVVWVRDGEGGYNKAGTTGTVVVTLPENANLHGSKYQVFWFTPDSGLGRFWTTPDDVRPIAELARIGHSPETAEE